MGSRQVGSTTWGCPGWKSPWYLVLLVASVLSSCSLLNQAAKKFINVVADPEKPSEGGDVTLIPQGAMKDFISCRWYRGVPADIHLLLIKYGPPSKKITTGPAYTHRETILPPLCSLQVTKLTANDSATYYVTLDKPGGLETGTVELEILGIPPARGSETGGLSKGAIAGIVVGCLAIVMVIAGVLYFRSTQVSH